MRPKIARLKRQIQAGTHSKEQLKQYLKEAARYFDIKESKELLDICDGIGKSKDSVDGRNSTNANSIDYAQLLLCCAAGYNNIGLAKYLLNEQRCDIGSRPDNEDDMAPIDIAAMNGPRCKDILKVFLSHTRDDITEIYSSIVDNELANLRDQLQKYSSDINTVLQVLHFAILYNSKSAVEVLIEKCQDTLKQEEGDGYPPLITAVLNKRTDIVELLCRNDIRITEQDTDGKTALHHAIEKNDTSILTALGKHVDFLITVEDPNGFTPLECAIIKGNQKIIGHLARNHRTKVQSTALEIIARDAKQGIHKPLIKSLSTHISYPAILQLAIKKNKQAAVCNLLNIKEYKEQYIDDKYNGYTALEYAVMHRKIDLAMDLLTYDKIKVNTVDKDGYTPLMHASMEGDARVVEKLLQNDAIDISKKDRFQNTAIHFAARNDHMAVVKLLLEHDEDREILKQKNKYGNTPLHLAALSGNIEVVKLLLEHDKEKNVSKQQNNTGNTPLHLAALTGNIKVVELFLEHDEDREILKQTNKYDNTPLHLAALSGNIEVVESLLKYDKDRKVSKQQNNTGNTPLHLAALTGNIEVVESLLKHDEKALNQKNQYGNTPLHLAALTGNIEVVELLLKYDKEKKILKQTNKYGNTPLHLAALTGNIEVVESLLKYDEKAFQQRNQYGNTPPHLATRNGHKKVVKSPLYYNKKEDGPEWKRVFLNCINERKNQSKTMTNVTQYLHMQSGDATHKKNQRRDIPARFTAQDSSMKILTIFLKKDNSINLINQRDQNGLTLLDFVILRNEVEILRKLLDHDKGKKALNQKNQYDNTPLHLAALTGNTEVVESLLKHDEKALNQKNQYGNTPLHLAALTGNIKVVKLLLKYDKEKKILKQKNNTGNTPLHLAALTGNIKVVELLLEHDEGKKVLNQKNQYGNTPLHLAALSGNTEVVELFLEHDEGKKVLKQTNKYGNTPLHLAALTGNTEVVESLLKHDEKALNQKNQYGETPINLAINYGDFRHIEVLKLLRLHDIRSFTAQINDTIYKAQINDTIYKAQSNEDVYKAQINDTIYKAECNSLYKSLSYYVQNNKTKHLQVFYDYSESEAFQKTTADELLNCAIRAEDVAVCISLLTSLQYEPQVVADMLRGKQNISRKLSEHTESPEATEEYKTFLQQLQEITLVSVTALPDDTYRLYYGEDIDEADARTDQCKVDRAKTFEEPTNSQGNGNTKAPAPRTTLLNVAANHLKQLVSQQGPMV